MKDLNLIELEEFNARSFMGIDSESPVVIHWPLGNKNQGVTLLKGDQGTKKSSTLTGIMALMGAAFNFETKNFVNLKDETIDVDMKFKHDGAKYHVIQSGNRLSLKRFYKETDKWIPEGTPKETLRKIFGSLGVSPMFLKDLPGKKQIEWFKETFGSDEEATKKEVKKSAELTVAFEKRRETNRIIKTLKGTLEGSPLYRDYEASQKRFSKPVSAEKEKKAFDELTEKNREYERAKDGLDQLRSSHTVNLKEIEELEAKLAKAKERGKDLQQRIVTGEKWLQDNKDTPKQYEKATAAWLNLSKTLADQTAWKEVLKNEKDYNEAISISQRYDAAVDRLRQDLLEITSTYLPKIKGLEIRTKAMSIDNGDEDEGIFYQNKSLAQLSESELWDLFLLIWEDKGVQFVFCENINALGSQAVATINRLVKEKKARILASEVDRSKDVMEISFTTKVA